MESRTYYDTRVSGKEQNLDRQIVAFETLGATERDIVTDKESGRNRSGKGKRQDIKVAPPLNSPTTGKKFMLLGKRGAITAKTAMEQTQTKRTSFYKLVKITESQPD